MGSQDSAISQLMMDAAETILRDEGYGALTSRRVAEIVGVKQRLVYYYYQTMDELIVATFRRMVPREIEALAAARANPRPLHEMWNVLIRSLDTRLVSEFMALANRIAALKPEVKAHIEHARAIMIATVKDAMDAAGAGVALPAEVAVVLVTSAMLALNREAELDVALGHAETMATIQRYITGLGEAGSLDRDVDPSRNGI